MNILFFFFIIYFTTLNASNNFVLEKIAINTEDVQSIKNGARIFIDKCQGCHNIKYMRYIDLAAGIRLDDEFNKGLSVITKEKLMRGISNINENSPILSSMNKEYAIKWFGKIPPDLSLVARYRGVNWLYTYMKAFYKDPSKPFGVNNLLFPDVGMPHVLLDLQGIQILKDNVNLSNKSLDNLEIIENGELSKEEYNNLVTDLVSFLSYVSEPAQLERQKIGTNVLIFLFIFMIVLYNLKSEYWKDIE